MLKAYAKMMAKTFDYQGTAEKQEYWLATWFNIILGIVVAIICISSYWLGSQVLSVIAIITTLWFAASIIASISLTVRRLRMVGRSGWWTCLMLVIGIGTLCLMLLCSTASFNASLNQNVSVYGMPSWENEYDPSKNLNEDVYGPPEWFD